jgi:hypothetical protein
VGVRVEEGGSEPESFSAVPERRAKMPRI